MADEITYRSLKEDERQAWREVYASAVAGMMAAYPSDQTADSAMIGEEAEGHAIEMIRRMRGER